jgi:hypothetical protein
MQRRLQGTRHHPVSCPPAVRCPVADGTSRSGKDVRGHDSHAMHASRQRPVLSLRGISKNFGAVSALTDIELDVPCRRGRRPGRRQRRRQVDAGQGARGRAPAPRPAPSLLRQGGDARQPRRRSISALRRSSRTWRCARTSTSSPTSSSAARLNALALDEVGMEVRAWTLLNELPRASPRCASPSPRSPAASARPSPSPARCCSTPSSSCSTSRPPRSASRRRPRC